MKSHHQRSRIWLSYRLTNYPFAAAASTAVSPKEVEDLIPGPKCSAVTQTGIRTWLFQSVEARDLFVNTVRTAFSVESESIKY